MENQTVNSNQNKDSPVHADHQPIPIVVVNNSTSTTDIGLFSKSCLNWQISLSHSSIDSRLFHDFKYILDELASTVAACQENPSSVLLTELWKMSRGNGINVKKEMKKKWKRMN